jgi:hypothetical protein
MLPDCGSGPGGWPEFGSRPLLSGWEMQLKYRTSLLFPSCALALGAVVVLLAGCVSGKSHAGGTGGGDSSGAGGGGGASSGAGGSGVGGAITMPTGVGLSAIEDKTLCKAGQVSVGATPLRRLSRIEYNNMVRDLGLDPTGTQPANQFVSEQKIPGNFNTNTYALISGTLMNRQYLDAAEQLAANAVTPANIGKLVSCAAQANAACAQQFIGDFANRAFRGQLDSDESAALLKLFNDVNTQFADFTTGIQAIITAVLTSPRFLFVLEFGQPGASGGAIPLSSMEMATRLSLFLWRSLPDQTLIDAAKAGQLATPDQVAAQATRMLADAKSQGTLRDFADQWLDIENMDAVTKDTQFKNWTPVLAQELHNETLTTFMSSVATDNTDFPSLLTSTSSYVNSDLAAYYNTGVPGTSNSTSYTKMLVGTSAAPRVGLLTHASVLSMHAHTSLPSPTLRGRMVRQQILCEQISPPPQQVGGTVIPPPPTSLPAGQTTRDQYMQHFGVNQLCSSCHQYMDYIGFGFDNYDATGAYITAEGGTQVDPSGMFLTTDTTNGLTGSFTTGTDMITKIAASTQARECFALQELRYAIQRKELPGDACSAQQVYQAFQSSGFNVQKLLLAIVQTDSFRNRSPVNAGAKCQ